MEKLNYFQGFGKQRENPFYGAEENAFGDLGRPMHYFQGSKEQTPWGPQRCDFTGEGGLDPCMLNTLTSQTRIMSLCVSIAFLCMSVYLSGCLSKYLHVFVCMYVCMYVCLSLPLSQRVWCGPSRPGFMSSIPGCISSLLLGLSPVHDKP